MLSFICYRRETVSVHVGRLHVEIRTIGRADAALSQAHGPKAVQVPSLSAIVLAKRPFVASHEKALMMKRAVHRVVRRERKRTLIDKRGGGEKRFSAIGQWSPSDPGRERETDDDISYIWDLKSRVASRPVPNLTKTTDRSIGRAATRKRENDEVNKSFIRFSA